MSMEHLSPAGTQEKFTPIFNLEVESNAWEKEKVTQLTLANIKRKRDSVLIRTKSGNRYLISRPDKESSEVHIFNEHHGGFFSDNGNQLVLPNTREEVIARVGEKMHYKILVDGAEHKASTTTIESIEIRRAPELQPQEGSPAPTESKLFQFLTKKR
jgi:hypothetical protein